MPNISAYALTMPPPVVMPSHGLSQEMDQILLGSNQPSSILRALYCLFKSRQKKTSLAFLCRNAGIPSKGYLALVMNGERRLHAKYWEGVFRAFKLNPAQRDLLHVLLELEQTEAPGTRAELERRLLVLRERLDPGACSLPKNTL